jgi:hypothetical protein
MILAEGLVPGEVVEGDDHRPKKRTRHAGAGESSRHEGWPTGSRNLK